MLKDIIQFHCIRIKNCKQIKDSWIERIRFIIKIKFKSQINQFQIANRSYGDKSVLNS